MSIHPPLSGARSPGSDRALYADVSRSIRDEDGDYGWRLRSDARGAAKAYEAGSA